MGFYNGFMGSIDSIIPLLEGINNHDDHVFEPQ